MLWATRKHVFSGCAPFWTPSCPILAPLALVGSRRLETVPGKFFSHVGSWGLPTHSRSSKMCLGPKNECFGVPVSMLLVDANSFGPHLAPFWPPWPLFGHVGWKRSSGGKIFTSRVLGPPNSFQCILNVFGTKNECFGVPVSMFLVDAHSFGPHLAPFWPPWPLLGHVAFKRISGR